MKLRLPNYYSQFQCIANKCKENCCSAGWEIDIDEKSANFYNSISGEFGEKLHKSINSNPPKHFILESNKKCPFLNKENLCEIYIKLGKEHLCEICSEHPRFYEWFEGVKEGGIGLCCEEAARIILLQNTPFNTYEIDIPYEECNNYPSELYSYLLDVRHKIILYLEDASLPLNSRIRDILWYSYTIQQNLDSDLLDDEELFNVTPTEEADMQSILEFFLTLESNNSNWIPYLTNCISKYSNSLDMMKKFEDANTNITRYLQNISVYFIWRYFLKGVFDREILSTVKFMVVSISVIKFLLFCKWMENGSLNFEDCIFIVKHYSEEVEYSDDNLSAFAMASYNETFFSVESLLGI